MSSIVDVLGGWALVPKKTRGNFLGHPPVHENVEFSGQFSCEFFGSWEMVLPALLAIDCQRYLQSMWAWGHKSVESCGGGQLIPRCQGCRARRGCNVSGVAMPQKMGGGKLPKPSRSNSLAGHTAANCRVRRPGTGWQAYSGVCWGGGRGGTASRWGEEGRPVETSSPMTGGRGQGEGLVPKLP